MTFASSPSDPIWLVLALPGDPRIHPAGLLFADFGLYAVLALTLQSASGATTLTLPVPNDPLLRGRALAFQGASFVTSSQTLFFSNPVLAVFD